MSSRYTAPTFDEARRWVAGVKHEGYSAQFKGCKAGKFVCETAWDGPKYQRFLSRFKGQAVVRATAESKSMMEQELL
jgi:hypothetical protein